MGQWYNTVNLYSLRNLTFEKDRLPALSGIARTLQRVTEFSYKAGIWLEDMHTGLLWSQQGTGKRRVTLDENVIPSWTWTGIVFGSPQYYLYDEHSGWYSHSHRTEAMLAEKATILEVSIETAEGDIYGQVTKGVLTIQGQYIAIKDWIARHRIPILYKKGEQFDLSDIHEPRTYAVKLTKIPQILFELDHTEGGQPHWSAEEYNADLERRVSLLQILKWDGHGKKPLPTSFCLILEPIGLSGVYERRGVAEVPGLDGMCDKGWELRTITIV
jgi:hypothetical protein